MAPHCCRSSLRRMRFMVRCRAGPFQVLLNPTYRRHRAALTQSAPASTELLYCTGSGQKDSVSDQPRSHSKLSSRCDPLHSNRQHRCCIVSVNVIRTARSPFGICRCVARRVARADPRSAGCRADTYRCKAARRDLSAGGLRLLGSCPTAWCRNAGLWRAMPRRQTAAPVRLTAGVSLTAVMVPSVI
jgi:hypothetical protein